MSNSQPKTEQYSNVSERFADSYYGVLGIHPWASAIEVRRAYRRLSKLYHPDTTKLPAVTATAKFQQLNEAYATLSQPHQRSLYDLKIGYRYSVIPSKPEVQNQKPTYSASAYLDPNDRPLSAGEVVALLSLTLTIAGCMILAIAVAIFRGQSF